VQAGSDNGEDIMKRSIIIFLFLISFIYPGLFAELPPDAYRKMQDNAPEYLEIQIFKVNKKNDLITVDARIDKVFRTECSLKPGVAITIKYEHIRSKLFIPGPRPIPILKKGKTYPAFLKKEKGKDFFSPAARGASFDPLVEY
jgi:hypothetical protein